MKRQTLNQLVNYFKNFNLQNFPQIDRPFSQKNSDARKVVQILQESVNNALKMIQFYEEKNLEMSQQNESLVCQIQAIQKEMNEEKNYNQKRNNENEDLIEKLRLQILSKQEQIKILTQKVEILQVELQSIQRQSFRNDLLLTNLKEHQRQLEMKRIKENEQKQIGSRIEELFNQLIQQKQLSLTLTKKVTQLEQKIRLLQSQIRFLQFQKQKNHSFSENNRPNQEGSDKKVSEDESFVSHDYKKLSMGDPFQTNQDNFPQFQEKQKFDFPQNSQTSLLRDILNCLEKNPYQKQAQKSMTPNKNQAIFWSKRTVKQKENIYDSIKKELQKSKSKYQQNSSKNLLLSDPLTKQIECNFANKIIENVNQNENNLFINEFKMQVGQNLKQTSKNDKNGQEQKSKILQQAKYCDPYYSFFILSAQCIKINSKYFQYVAQVDVEQFWDELIQKRIAINKWCEYIEAKIFQKANIPQEIRKQSFNQESQIQL